MQLNGINSKQDMADLIISKKNEVFLKVECEPHIKYELQDQFTFEVPNAKFMPQYRNKYWDGKIRLFCIDKGEIYVGLLDKLIAFCKNHKYTFEFENNKFYGLPYEENDMISEEGVKDYMTKISRHKPRDYQIEGVFDALKRNRRLIISPTGSGKSLMIYSVVRYHVEQDRKVLVVVPTTSLVEQMFKDFEDYGWNSEDYCHKIYSGRERISDKQVVITTWQSIYKMDREWFEPYDVIVGDEAHQFKSKSLVSIMSKLADAKYRYGFTGTLDGTQTHKWVLEGLFGPSYKVINTKELQDAGHLAKLNIKVLLLKHDPQKFETYEDEVQYLIGHEKRNKFIRNLAWDLKGNTLILFSRVLTHGQILYDLINTKERKVFFVHGGVDVEEREEVRRITEQENDAIIIASFGTFSTGINIKNLHNVVFSSPSKSRIRTLQSIGRVLRKSENKLKSTLYDIADDCKKGSRSNYTLNHLVERIKYYNEEKFNYEIIQIKFQSE
jgi:superfamily II DNA or RNA helicase